MNATILLVKSAGSAINSSAGYIIGIVIAILLFGYLLYALVKPENF